MVGGSLTKDLFRKMVYPIGQSEWYGVSEVLPMTSIDRGLGRIDTHGRQCPIVVAHKFCVDKPQIKEQTIDAPLKETLIFLSGLHHCLILDCFLEEYICLFSSSIPSSYSAGHVRRPTMRDPVVVKLLKSHSKGQDSSR